MTRGSGRERRLPGLDFGGGFGGQRAHQQQSVAVDHFLSQFAWITALRPFVHHESVEPGDVRAKRLGIDAVPQDFTLRKFAQVRRLDRGPMPLDPGERPGIGHGGSHHGAQELRRAHGAAVIDQCQVEKQEWPRGRSAQCAPDCTGVIVEGGDQQVLAPAETVAQSLSSDAAFLSNAAQCELLGCFGEQTPRNGKRKSAALALTPQQLAGVRIVVRHERGKGIDGKRDLVMDLVWVQAHYTSLSSGIPESPYRYGEVKLREAAPCPN